MGDEALHSGQFDAAAAVVALSRKSRREFELVGPMDGGETGATEVVRSDGVRFVLKWELDPGIQQSRREGAVLAERLRTEAHWPSPRQELIERDGCLLVLQEFMPGEIVENLSHTLVDDVLELHEARLGLQVPIRSSTWAQDMIALLIEGGNGYCLHEPLRRFDRRSRAVIERIEEIGRRTDPADLHAVDIVHNDLHPGNLLQINGNLTAVVDMDFTRIGDAVFDLTALAVASLEVSADSGVRDRLIELGVESLPTAKRRVYVSNFLLRNLDWSIRKNRSSDIEFWLNRAEPLLAPA